MLNKRRDFIIASSKERSNRTTQCLSYPQVPAERYLCFGTCSIRHRDAVVNHTQASL